MEKQVESVKVLLNEIRSSVSKDLITKLEIDKCERIVERLGTFSTNCHECQQQLIELKNHVEKLSDNLEQIEESEIKQHKQMINLVVSHFQKKHQLVPEGHYLAIYLSLGISLGLVFGLVIFDNIALGIPIGMSLGVALGAGMDADAKKKGNTI
ncbi:hypothetical protein [Bacillus sp. PS06]|uniref:hypothetical protein n=1 Tax=Bacillus sp. PS06 TaxID=2764176 RepID=UPI001CD8FBF8|nr:hypothetical protein [Bacillus sp. PS06]